MSLTTGRKRTHLEMLDSISEYQALLADISPPLNIGWPSSQKLPVGLEKDAESVQDYWKNRPLIFRTDNLTEASNDTQTQNAVVFIREILLDRLHPARLYTLNEPKTFQFDILVRWNFKAEVSPMITAVDIECLLNLLHSLKGDARHIKLKLFWKDMRDPTDLGVNTRKEIAPNHTGHSRFMKERILNFLHISTMKYTVYRNEPMKIPPDISDREEEFVKYKDSLANSTSQILDCMWYPDAVKQGFVEHQICKAFDVPVTDIENDKHIAAYLATGVAIPTLTTEITPQLWTRGQL
ncbi:hypothetical protein E4T42_06122 [Aureobasidium subglaciale]|nr:hypothetical protein E4T42_06122 [Aureobasidium subglaciale]